MHTCELVLVIVTDRAFISIVFFFKQKTAYEMRISDWSSDVCSSDLGRRLFAALVARRQAPRLRLDRGRQRPALGALDGWRRGDRKSVVSGKSVSVRVDLGGRRIIKKKPYMNTI